jgi:hypothetical protein
VSARVASINASGKENMYQCVSVGFSNHFKCDMKFRSHEKLGPQLEVGFSG